MMIPLLASATYLKAVRPIGEQRVEAVLKDGSQVTIDLAPLIERHARYWRLKHDRYFRMVSLDEQGVLSWPEGEDVAPESVSRYLVDPQNDPQRTGNRCNGETGNGRGQKTKPVLMIHDRKALKNLVFWGLAALRLNRV